MAASGSGSGSDSNKRRYVPDDDTSVKMWWEQEKKFKVIIYFVKKSIRETEQAYWLDITYREKQAERDLLAKMEEPGFNLKEEIRIVDKELKESSVEKDAFKVHPINWDKLGYGSTDDY